MKSYYYVTSQGPEDSGPMVVIGTDNKDMAHEFAFGYAPYHSKHKVWIVRLAHDTIRNSHVEEQLTVQDPDRNIPFTFGEN